MRLNELLETTSSEMPGKLALVEFGGRTCSYRELGLIADDIAIYLRDLGVAAGDRIGLCTEKTIESIAAIFGILKVGAAYVPVDPDAPVTRNAAILSNCEVHSILISPTRSYDLSEALEAANYPCHAQGSLVAFDVLTARAPGQITDEEVAYILYTSGSTGVPKGVVHTHGSALAFIDWCSREFRPSNEDHFTSHAPLHFDLSILDIYVPVKHGASIRLIGSAESKNPRALARIIAVEKPTFWYSTPTVLRSIAEHGLLETTADSKLRVVCFAGEVFATKHFRALAELLPRSIFYNLYGPTETNVCAFFRVASPVRWIDAIPIPIGSACSNAKVRVVDSEGNVLSYGQIGELWVCGPSLMIGYWNDEAATAKVFSQADGQKWYRTADSVIESEQGVFTFHGRRDRMVKRRGYRIELDEIEAALMRHKQVSEAAVVSVLDASGDLRIVAFVVCTNEPTPSYLDMKRFCSQALPIYMSPDFFHCLSALHYTSTDKVDYIRLVETANEIFSELRATRHL